jgi:class 3 adenylate cyclase
MVKKRAFRVVLPLLIGALAAQSAFLPTLGSASGTLFDTLRALRPPSVPSRDLLLVEIDAAALHEGGPTPWSGAALAESLLLLYEMEASAAVLSPKVEGETFRGNDDEGALRSAFDREFGLIKTNIATLFQAIRLGSVRAKDSEAFVAELGALVDAGKQRLFSTAVNGDRADALLLERAAGLFGRVYRGDGEAPTDASVRATFSRLGVPEDRTALGRAAFAAALDRLGSPRVEVLPDRIVLRGAAVPGAEVRDLELNADASGALLLDYPPREGKGDFRRLSFEPFLRHQRLERELYGQLKAMERTGYVSVNTGSAGADLSPVAVYEYAAGKRAELLASRSGGGEWRELRERFFRSSDSFLNGAAESKILAGYDALIALPTATPESAESLRGLKSAAANSFSRARAALRELTELRASLRLELERSLCILAAAPEDSAAAEAAAALADAALTGRTLSVVPPRQAFFLSLLLAVGLAGALSFLGFPGALAVGTLSAAAAYGLAALSFLVYGAWFSPLVPALAILSVALSSALIAGISAADRRRRLRRAFGGRLSGPALAALEADRAVAVLSGLRTEATVLAVRAPALADYPRDAEPRQVAAAFRLYHERVGRALSDKGAFVYAAQGELVFAVFGPPLGGEDHRTAACAAALALAGAADDPSAPAGALAGAFAAAGIPFGPGALRIGIDSGPCDFASAGLPGSRACSVFGPVPLRARLLSGLGERYGCAAILSEEVRAALKEGAFGAVRLDKLVSRTDGREEWFYELRPAGEEGGWID